MKIDDYLQEIKEAFAQKDAEIEDMKALLTRATDVLKKYTDYPLGMVMSVTLRETGRDLIDELRKLK